MQGTLENAAGPIRAADEEEDDGPELPAPDEGDDEDTKDDEPEE